jgi:biopolymer transport protein ExbD
MGKALLMADVSSHPQARSPARRFRARKSPRLDMTAMVDVAFLLLTFFVLTASMGKDRLMEMVMPPPCEDCGQAVKAPHVLTLVLDEADSLSYFQGMADEPLSQGRTGYHPAGLRALLFAHLNRERPRCEAGQARPCWDPMVVIKAHPDSPYGRLVDILDEIAIAGMPKYALAPYDPLDPSGQP